jgi:hypothetical protein
MQSADRNIDLEAHVETFLQLSRDHLLRRSTMSTWLRTFLKAGLYLAAILLVPGALIGAPILWWLGHRGKARPQPTWKACS